ncbi:MAG: hypothetical protein ACE5JB_14275 [bacterium]
MNDNVKKYAISENLYDLTENQIANLDHETTGGEGWNCYCNSYISHPTVFQNKISGRFKNFVEDHYVEVKVQDEQIITFCSTCRQGEICAHVVALLYSWIYDSEGFNNVAESLKHLEGMDKRELIEIIGRMVLQNPGNLDIFKDNLDEENDYDLDGLLN